MNIKTQELGLTQAAKRNLLMLEGVETLEDLKELYSQQELTEDHYWWPKKTSVTSKSIEDCLLMYEVRLYPTFYDRMEAQGKLPSVNKPEEILLVECDFPEEMIDKLKLWKKFRTMGEISKALEEHGGKHEPYELLEFIRGVGVSISRFESKTIRLDLQEKRLLIRTLALHGLYPKHAQMKKRLEWW